MNNKKYKDLNVGDEIIVPHKEYGDIPFIVIGKDHDAPNSLTLMTKEIIQLIQFDADELDSADEDRYYYGNNRYKYSNVHQWMNSDAEAGQWYTPQHEYDRAPYGEDISTNNYTPYINKPGLLNGFSDEFKDKLITVDKRTSISKIDGGGSEFIPCKVFLLSNTEVGLDNINGIDEGEIYEYFDQDDTNKNILAYPSEYCLNHSRGYGYGTSDFAQGKPWKWWLRTPYSSTSHYVSIVWLDGTYYPSCTDNGDRGLRFCLVINTSDDEITNTEDDSDVKLDGIINEWIQLGHDILDKKYWETYDKYISKSPMIMCKGHVLRDSLSIIRALNGGESLSHARIIFKNQIHSPMSRSLVLNEVTAFCDRGRDFREYHEYCRVSVPKNKIHQKSKSLYNGHMSSDCMHLSLSDRLNKIFMDKLSDEND